MKKVLLKDVGSISLDEIDNNSIVVIKWENVEVSVVFKHKDGYVSLRANATMEAIEYHRSKKSKKEYVRWAIDVHGAEAFVFDTYLEMAEFLVENK